MDFDITAAMKDIESTPDLLERALKLSGVVSTLFSDAGWPLMVVGLAGEGTDRSDPTAPSDSVAPDRPWTRASHHVQDHGLDAADAGGRGLLFLDLEAAQLTGGGRVRAAAHFHREVAHGENLHLLAVLGGE
jgi:hypothetical protein